MIKADAAVIGFGKGGKTIAGALAGSGKTVVMIEKSDRMYGGTCINVACIPTKSLVHSAALSAAQGGSFREKSERYEKAIEEKDRLTEMLRGKNYHKLADNGNVTVLNGTGSFADSTHVKVKMADGKEEEIEAGKIFINTGARPFVPPIPGLAESRYAFVSEELLDQKKLPHYLTIIGGGYIGMEFASMYANFGSHVTVVQDGAQFLPREDSEIADAVEKSLEDRGIEILKSTKILKAEDRGGQAVMTVEIAGEEGAEPDTEEIYSDAILVATGRRPNTEDLNPEAAGVELTERGAVKVDAGLKTTADNIWAMGDIVGGLQFTYISLDDFRIVKSQILGDGTRSTENRGAVPYSVFLDPPFSRVGMTEKEALDKGYQVRIFKLPAAAIPKAQVLRKPAGLLKAVVDEKTGKILGAHLFCEESYEIINLLKLAIDQGIPYTVLRDSIYTHPTMTEGLNDLFAG